jgi:hypothetical protein
MIEFLGTDENDEEGNYWHICVEGHGVTQEEVEEVVAENYDDATTSASSGKPTVFGWTSTGKYITVVFDVADADVPQVYPMTAYEVPPPGKGKRRKRRR